MLKKNKMKGEKVSRKYKTGTNRINHSSVL